MGNGNQCFGVLGRHRPRRTTTKAPHISIIQQQTSGLALSSSITLYFIQRPDHLQDRRFAIASLQMTTHGRSHHNNRLVHAYCRPDDDISSTTSPTVQSFGSQNSQIHCNKGLDMIESLFSKIFAGCCRGVQCSANIEARPSNMRTHHHSHSDPFKIETPQRRRGNFAEKIPQPPEIRRLALDEEIGRVDLDRSGSLSFLFYQEEAVVRQDENTYSRV